jgi:hypothetical protein
MLFLQNHHIIDVYCVIDDVLPPVQKPKGGRPPLLTESELATILIWNTLTVRQKTIKDIYKWILLYHHKDFPRLPHYSAFVYECQKITPYLCFLLDRVLLKETPFRLMDSTMIEVCKLSRADSHRVAKGVAAFGKNHQGWHYGFKLHASIDFQGRFSGLTITPANEHDAQMMPRILNQYTKIAVGDTSYGASVMREKLWKKHGAFVLAYPHPKQKRKLMADWQQYLLELRPKIETVFDYLKEHLHFVSSFPRSVGGYLFHYVRILLGYQVMTLSR